MVKISQKIFHDETHEIIHLKQYHVCDIYNKCNDDK